MSMPPVSRIDASLNAPENSECKREPNTTTGRVESTIRPSRRGPPISSGEAGRRKRPRISRRKAQSTAPRLPRCRKTRRNCRGHADQRSTITRCPSLGIGRSVTPTEEPRMTYE
jgi:hypothetical protein